MKPLKLLNNTIMSPTKPLGNGRHKAKLKLKKQKVDTEDTMSQPKRLILKKQKSSTPESHPANKKKTLKIKSNSSKKTIQNTNLSQTSVQESISNEMDLSPFWTESLKETSQKLWLPIKTDLQDLDSTCCNTYVKSLDANSELYQRKNTIRQKNCQKISCPLLQSSLQDIMDCVNIQKAKKLRIYPNSNQKELFKECLNTSRYIYNNCIAFNKNIYQSQLKSLKESKTCANEKCKCEKEEDSFFCSKHSKDKIKWQTHTNPIELRKHVLVKDKDLTEENMWLKKTPFDTKELMIRNYCTSLKTNMTRLKNKSIANFDMSFKSRKNMKQIFLINKNALKVVNNHIYLFQRRLRKNALLKIKKKDKIEIKQNCILQKNGNKYFLIIPFEEKVKHEDADYDLVSLDPGVRDFQSFYSPEGICGTLNMNKERRNYLLKKIQKLIKKKKTKRIPQLRTKIENTTTNSHWNIIKFLTKNFSTIIIPAFETSNMVKKGKSILKKKTKSEMLGLCHYKFLTKLKFKCKEQQRKLVICEESYTSKTCSNCGILHHKLGGNKTFKCPHCKIVLDRDLNGARNILLKQWGS